MRSSGARARALADDDSLASYLQEIRAYPLLSKSEETTLARRIHDDPSALQQLVCANLRFVVSVAKHYQNRGLPLSDLINEGNLGLIRAAEKFEEGKGVRFISYAVWWIRQAIIQAISEQGHTVRVPPNRSGMTHQIARCANSLRQELGREPTQREVAVRLKVSEADFVMAASIGRSYLSLDAPVGDDDDTHLLDYLADDTAVAPDEAISDDNLMESVEGAFTVLREREARVLRLYFGFDGNESMTLESIGLLLGVTRERVRQIKQRGLARLRRSSHAPVLETLCHH